MLDRCRPVGMPVDAMIETGKLHIHPVEPLSYSPDELALAVRADVEQRGVQTVVLDSSSGYQMSVSRLFVAGEPLHHLQGILRGVPWQLQGQRDPDTTRS